MSNLEYESSFGGAYIMFSTFEPGPVNVKVYRRTNSGTDWTSQSIYNQNIYPGSPKTWSLDRARTAEFFRYATSSSKYTSSWLTTDDFGLKIVASKNIYVRVVLQPDNRQGNPTSYGNGTATHGAAFTSKGVTRGAGVEFYTAHLYTQNKRAKSQDQDFISVMSLEDGNTISLNSPRSWYTPNGLRANTTITLDEGESALFKRSWSSNNHSLGTRVYSTNNKEMVVTSGSWAGRLKDNEGNSQDLGIEQLVPVKALGKKYLMSKTKSRNNSNNYRVGIVVTAVEEGTTSYTFNGSSYTLSRGGVRFHRIPNFNNNGTGNVSGGPYAVISDKKLLATYQAFGNAQTGKDNQFGMTILGPLYDSYSSPGYNKISLGNGYYEHAVWKGQGDETLTLFYMTNATNAELNSLASGKVKFQGTSLNPTTNFYTAGSQTIDGETWQIRYREIDDAGRNNNVVATSNSESFFDFSSIDKPVYVWWQAGFDKQGNVTSISPYQVGGCDVPTITQQPSITPNNADEGTNSQLRVTTSPSSGVSYTWQISPDGNSWENLSSGAVSGTTFSSPTAATVNLTGLSLDLDDYQFRVVVENATDASCVVTSTAVTLNVNCTNPTISGQPSDLTVAPGSTASFTATGTHANGVTYNWQVSTNGGSSYVDAGVTSSTINFSDLGVGSPGLGNNGWKFKIRVYNSKDNTCYVESNVATLNVVAANDCPVYNPIILSSNLKEDLDDIVLNLNTYVTDADSDTVSYTNISSNNTTLVAATLSGTASLVLNFQENQSGSAQISFDFTDGNSGCDNTATFNVNIQAVDDCPTLNTPLNDLSAIWNSNDQIISLTNLFVDIDTTNLTYTVSNTDDSVVTTTISGTNLIIDFLENQYGTVTVTVGVDQIGGYTSFTASDIATSADGARSVFAADMDGDGDMDILSASWIDDTIAWYENNNGDASSWTATDIATSADGAWCVFAADMDGDGDMDILSASSEDDTIAWYENNNGDASSWTATDIATNADSARSVFAADMDGDGDMDILSASWDDDTIAWYENNNGDASSWTATDIATNANGAYSVFAADMDGDGDMDIVSASYNDDTIAWYENNNGDASSWTATDIATNANGAQSVYAADMDGDGDIDIVSASHLDDTIAWYENNNGDASSWTATDIATSADGAFSVYAADMDGDGDMDIVSASPNDDTIAWYENNGAVDPTWTASDIATSADSALSVYAADMDGDGDMDIVSASHDDDTIAWYENSAACTVSDTFVVTVIKPNQEPSFTKGPNITVCENSGAYTAIGWATDIDDGDGGTQNVSFDIISNSNPGIFDIQPQISATGTLTFTLKANRSGNVTLLARIQDDGGTANGGDNQSDPQTFYITVNAQDNPDFIFSVSGFAITEICENDSRSIDLIVSGTSNQGTFTVSPSDIVSFTYVTPSSYNFTVNSTGTATITFTTSGTCPGTVTKTITLTADEDPSFTYSTATFCNSDSDPSPTITTSGGTFSSSAGLVFTDTSSGTIDLDGSTPGSYTVTYTTSGLCATATSTLITIESDDMSFTYDSNSYSQSCPNPTPTITGITSGTFSSSVSLTIDATTGEITTSTSSPGTYTVTYSLIVPTTTNWTKALDFSGGSQYVSMSGGGTSAQPLGMNAGSGTTPANPNTSRTVTPTSGQPWATAVVFKYDGNASDQYIWNQAGFDPDDRIYLRLDASGYLYFGWDSDGVGLNECRFIYLGTTTNTNHWWAVYIGHDGTRLSAGDANAANLAAAFDIRTMTTNDAPAAFTNLSSNRSTAANWTAGSTGGTMARSYAGSFSIGGRGSSNSFHGKIASMVVTTLERDVNKPTDAEIKMMITDPMRWLTDYKEGKSFRQPNNMATTNFVLNNSSNTSIYGTQVWLMGDGTNDSYSNGIRNQVAPAENTYSKLNLNNMVSSDIEAGNDINMPGDTSDYCATPASFEVTITAAVNADFSYPSTPYCSSSANVTPTVTGQSGGSFTVPTGLSLLSSSTGEIDISASTPGSYTVSYTVIECGSSITATTTLEITASVTATIAYTSTTTDTNGNFVFNNQGTTSPTTFSGHVTGTFTASPTGLSFTSTSTGEINLVSSTFGTYEITFTPSATCSIPVTTTLKIQGCPYVENPIGYPLIIPSSQIAFYEFEGNGDNSVSGSYDLTLVNATYENQQSQGVSSTFKGQSSLFKTSGQYAYVHLNDAFSGASGLTISTWVKIKEIEPGFVNDYNYVDLIWINNGTSTATTSNQPRIRNFIALKNDNSKTFTINGKATGGDFSANNDENQLNLTTIETDKKWHHCAFSIDFDNQNARLFIDGELYANSKFTGNYKSVDFLLVGDISTQNNQLMYDELRIFDTALTDKKIRNIAHTSQHQRSTTATPQTDPTFDLSNLFTDPNSNDTLTYTASVTYQSENGLATVSISSSTLTVDINDATEGGNAVIEVTASDGTCSSTHTFNLIVLPDKDQDGIADEDDLDDDNDGILDTVEGTDTDGDGIPDDDADGDGVPNHLDTDSDNDGCLDSEEAGYFLGTSSIVVDSQGRRINDNQGPITIGTDAYTASNTLLDINGNSVRDYLEDGPTITFSYAESYYCTSGTDPTPTLNFTVSGVISGTISPTGTFSSSPTGLVFSNTSSGTIDLSASASNTYTITFNSTTGGCPSTVTATLQIIGQDDATFSYDSASYCANDSNPTPTITSPGGTFSASASLTINTATGEITTATSSPGTYTVTYTTAGTCSDTSSVQVTIHPLDDASFSYPRLSYCKSDSDPIPALTASQTLTGGTFTAGSGLSFTSSSTGIIDLSASTSGTYTVTFTTNGNCPQSSSSVVTINDLDDASFSYAKAAYCINESDPSAIITGTTLGKFTSSSGLIFTNTYSGTIDLDASIPGTYTVTYTTPDVIQDGLVLYLDTENPDSYSGSGNTWYDLSRNNNDLTLYGNPSFNDEMNGGVIDFDEINDFAQTNSTAVLNRTSYTKIAIFYPRSGTRNIISGNGSGVSEHAFWMGGSEDRIRAGHNVQWSTLNYSPGNMLNRWHYSAVTFSNTDGFELFYNGTSVQSNTTATAIPNGNGLIRIGAYGGGGAGGSNYFDGYIPVVLVYDRALNAEEIALNYNYFAGRYGLTRLGDIGGFCPNSSSFEITINPLDNADFTYDSPTYCVGGTDPTPTITGLTGGAFSSTASLSIDTASGTIDLSASSPGSYTVTYTTSGNCTNTGSFNVTIIAQDDGTFSYGSLLYCKGDTNPTPTISEFTGGTFVSTAGLSFVSSSTGEIDLSTSVSGTYTVSYTTGGTCTVTTSQIVQIADQDDASFSFPRNNYTLNCDNPLPTITGLTGGVWEAPPGLNINTATGEINLSASASGTYTVSYTVENLCRNTATTTIVLSPADDPYFSYSKYSYCINESDPIPLNIATVSGTFSGSASITVNANTGVIDISASSVGNHVITYTTSSTCPSTSSRTITITPLEDASFTFNSNSYCKGSTNVSPTITTPGGSFTSPVGLYMNASSGLINIALSTPGTYTVTYTTAGTCTNTATGTITIDALDDASFSYAQSNYCPSESDPSATITGLSGGTFSSTSGLIFTNTSSGTIDLDASTPGTYTVTYTTAGTCTNTAGFELIITAQDSATISYASASYCALESDPTPTITGYSSGTYSSTTGLIINTATGQIDVSASASGTYTVSYTTQETCPITVTATVQIIECPDTDGDGVPDITENIDGTDPNDLCDYVVNSQDASKSTNAWNNADCDGDGVTNNQEIIDETDPNDVCSYEPTSQQIGNVTAAWNSADCDGDGITNEDENNDGTDVFDSCNGVNTSVTLPITTTTDCDGDGSIGDDPDNLSPGGACSWGTQDLSLTTPFWQGLDCDGDGVTNGNEVNDGTNPQNACDYTYSSISLTVSATNDCDGDGVGNDQESLDGTDPDDVCSYVSSSVSLTLVTGTWNSADCDGDGVTNGQEVINGTDWASICSFTLASQTVSPSADWNAADCDGDGVNNGQEISDGTDPSDGCSYTAANITLNQSSAWRALDCDQDGVTNGQELTDGTNPQDACSYDSANQLIANVGATWNAADCDGDSISNGQEVVDGTDPTDTCSYTNAGFNAASTTAIWQNADCDQDGVTNGQENTDGTDPEDACDYTISNQVIANVGLTWNNADCDGDGVTNGQEINDNTATSSPCDFITENITESVSATLDCDGDSVPNAQELIDGTDPQLSCDYLIANFNVASVTASWDALDCDGDGVINGTEKGTTDYHDDCSFTTASITVSVTSSSDCDGDGVTNAQEDTDNTDPKDECSFVDANITLAPTTPKDCDGDGVLDTDEEIDGTDANDICDFVFSSQSTTTIALWATLDCDGDGVTNGDEITDGTNPKEVCSYLSTSVSSTLVSTTWNTADCDGDGVTNEDESEDFTDPLSGCDFNFDSQTLSTSTDWDNLDCDGDGVTNEDELTDTTNPLFSCDFIPQSITVSVTSNLDCDADGVSNANEFIDNTDPLDPCDLNPGSIDRIATAIKDCDEDGVDDETEVLNGTDPNNACSYNLADITMGITNDSDCDGDGIPNSIEIEIDETDPNDACDFNTDNIVLADASATWRNGDCDGDGVTNGQEITNGTDPKDLCSNVIANQTLPPSDQWNSADCNNDGYCNSCPIPEVEEEEENTDTTTSTIDDLDGDGIEDSLDEDDDGDGVPDLEDEFPRDGSEWEDLDGDGVGNNKDIDDDNDGINDAIESPNRNEDFDGDGIPNYLDYDSDNDGCPDVIEAGFIDSDGDNILGDLQEIEFNEVGQVISEAGYSQPADGDNNGILDFLEEGSQVEITLDPPPNASILRGRKIILDVRATSLGAINYQWQVNKSGAANAARGAQWENIENGNLYLGTKSNQLIIREPNQDMIGWRYRVIAFSPCFVCGDIVSSESTELVFIPLSLPKGFSPNGDGYNDTWVIKGLENYITNKLTIYNRWEIKVYEKTNYQNNWDGSSYLSGYGGTNKLPSGIYFYILELDREKPITGYIYLKNE